MDICYVCHEEESVKLPFLRPAECACSGTYMLHVECFRTILQKGYDSCSICKIRWKFLPVIQDVNVDVHGRKYVQEYMTDDSGRRHGEFREMYQGKLHIKCRYVHGLLDGWFLTYDIKTGLLRHRVYYIDGKKDGVGMYYRGGVLKAQSAFYHGVRHGQTLFFKKNGSYHFVMDHYYGRQLDK